MGGGPVRNINLLIWGVDLVEEHLLTTAGIPSRPPTASAPLMHIAEFTSNAKKTGTVQVDNFCEVSLLVSNSCFLVFTSMTIRLSGDTYSGSHQHACFAVVS